MTLTVTLVNWDGGGGLLSAKGPVSQALTHLPAFIRLCSTSDIAYTDSK